MNFLQIEESDETGTFVPGMLLPAERSIETFDIEYFSDPQPLPPWTDSYVLQVEETGALHIRKRRRGPLSERTIIREVGPIGDSVLTIPHHGTDFVAVSGGTIMCVECKNAYTRGKLDEHPSVMTMYYRSDPASTEHDFQFHSLGVSPRSRTAFDEALAGYEAYAVENWDGYDALPITPETLAAARAVLKVLPKKPFGEPECSPGADGSIGFEWIMDSGPVRKLFIDIGPSRTWKAYWRFANGQSDAIPRKRISLSTSRELTSLFERLGA
jgi:hypothetical protein